MNVYLFTCNGDFNEHFIIDASMQDALKQFMERNNGQEPSCVKVLGVALLSENLATREVTA